MVVVLRRICSFVRREGRITLGQQQALTDHWQRFGIDFPLAEGTLNWSNVFGRDGPLVVDIGFGNGESVVALAQAHPEWNIIGIEVYRPGVGHLFRQLAENQINNVRVICHDAVEVLQTAFAHHSLSRVQIFFPDPWPKKRHHKRRLIQPNFLALIADRLQVDGELALATDWQNYAEHMAEVLLAQPLLQNMAQTLFASRDTLRPLTRFERRGQLAGHEVWDLHFKRL